MLIDRILLPLTYVSREEVFHQQDVLEDTKTISRVGALNIYSHRSMDWYIQRQVQGLLKGMKQASGVKTTVAITCTFSTFSTDSYAE
jgi:hypothetical protein